MTVRSIQRTVSEFYEIPLQRLKGRDRSPVYSMPRMVAMHLSRNVLGYSLPHIGKEFNRDHTTVLDADQRISRLLAEGAEPIAKQVETLRTLIEAPPPVPCCEKCGRSYGRPARKR